MVAPAQDGDEDRFDEEKAATIQGYVIDVKTSTTPESCNCDATDPVDQDTHIEIGLSPDAPPNQRVIVEITPRLRKSMVPSEDWSTEALQQRLTGNWVQFTGWMLFDYFHAKKSENTHPGNPSNWRATAWEIHPVTSLTVLTAAPPGALRLQPAQLATLQAASTRSVKGAAERMQATKNRLNKFLDGLTPKELKEIQDEDKSAASAKSEETQKPEISHRRMEAYPEQLLAKLELRDRFLRSLPRSIGGHQPSFVILTTRRWQPAQTVKVAFRGGTAPLYQDIAAATQDWTGQANIKLDFMENGQFREWSTSDIQYKADTRVSFDHSGYYSLIGTDSVNPAITTAGEESMNFQGFAQQRPADWRGVVLHEFGHALGFEHEHQHPTEGCDSDFRWNDDPGYIPTTDDQSGQFIADAAGKRPGIYMVLGGPPNNWPRQKVDFNLKELPESHAYDVSPFDRHSIMKYYFPAWMFVSGEASHCFSAGENPALSPTDIDGIKKAYPFEPTSASRITELRKGFLSELSKIKGIQAKSRQHFESLLRQAGGHN
jgi:hypothetical protein